MGKHKLKMLSADLSQANVYENPAAETTLKPKEDQYTHTPISPTQVRMSEKPFLETTPKITDEQSTNHPISPTKIGVPESMSTPMIEQLRSAQAVTEVTEAESTTLQTSGTVYKIALILYI